MECEDTQVCWCWLQPPQQEATLTHIIPAVGAQSFQCVQTTAGELPTTEELWKVVWKQSFMQWCVEERHVANRKETGSTGWLKEQAKFVADFGPGQTVHYEKTCHQYSVGGLQYLQTHLGSIWLTGLIQPLASCSCLMIERRTFVSSCH